MFEDRRLLATIATLRYLWSRRLLTLRREVDNTIELSAARTIQGFAKTRPGARSIAQEQLRE